jgi:hypothetical protein
MPDGIFLVERMLKNLTSIGECIMNTSFKPLNSKNHSRKFLTWIIVPFVIADIIGLALLFVDKAPVNAESVSAAMPKGYSEPQTSVEYWEGFGDGYCMDPQTPLSMPNPNPDICGHDVVRSESTPTATTVTEDDTETEITETEVVVVIGDPKPEDETETEMETETETHTDNGNHYGNDKPDNNSHDVNNSHNGENTAADHHDNNGNGNGHTK